MRQSQTLNRTAPLTTDISLGTSLSLNPHDNTLLLSDRRTGNIVNCSSDLRDCNVYINRSKLETNFRRTHVGKTNIYTMNCTDYAIH